MSQQQPPEIGFENMLVQLDERQRKEVSFARDYALNFKHGTAGHTRLLLIAKLADMIDIMESNIENILRLMEWANGIDDPARKGNWLTDQVVMRLLGPIEYDKWLMERPDWKKT